MRRVSTPPPRPEATAASASPSTPVATRLLEESRLRSKALRDRHEAARRATGTPPRNGEMSSGSVAPSDTRGTQAPSKRPHSSVAPSEEPAAHRDGSKQDGEIRPARKFAKFVDYHFSAATDTKGGFLSAEDDPWNKTSAGGGAEAGPTREDKPKHMTADEWERLQLLRDLKRRKEGPFEPGLSVLADERERKQCRECASREIDWTWEEVLGCRVCHACKDKFPEKYSLLTKTECREDYLLTEPELKDAELLPHLSRPNPHKSHWHDMMLFVRYQVEAYAFGEKWGSAEALDAEFARRESDKKRRKDAKFKEKLLELKKKTRTDAFRRNTKAGVAARGGRATEFGDAVGGAGKHVHEWGRALEDDEGVAVKKCLSCGMEVEELDF